MFEMLFKILIMMLGFGLLIFVHELGHFLAAKWAGIRTEAFAVGMGPVAFAWRKGVGFAPGSTHQKVVTKTGRAAISLTETELKSHGIGETEYSLRWLPIGGFVKMLGQDDLNPTAASGDPRSYTQTPVWKRMIVVSAGVVANLILAVGFFILAFVVGVSFEGPRIGDVAPTLPAGSAIATNASELGVENGRMQPGDVVARINGDVMRTFADVRNAVAMAGPDETLTVEVERAGLETPLVYEVKPEKSPLEGLLSLGVAPAFTTTLYDDPQVSAWLAMRGLGDEGVEPGMRLTTINGAAVERLDQVRNVIESSRGAPLNLTYAANDGTAVNVTVDADPQLQPLIRPDGARERIDFGLLGLTPLVRIEQVTPESPNADVIRAGDVVLKVGGEDYPTMSSFRAAIIDHTGGPLPMTVLRNGERVSFEATLRNRQVGVLPGLARDLPMIATPVTNAKPPATRENPEPDVETTAIAGLPLTGGTLIRAIDDTPVNNWREIRAALQAAGAGEVALTVTYPIGGDATDATETVVMTIGPDDAARLADLTWTSNLLEPSAWRPEQVLLKASNPVEAVSMGVDQSWNMMVNTYFTLLRLVQGTVGVEQLRGPVGIVHIGTTVVDRGAMYFIFFLALISVNLAVLNFLPLPIVDGGLFLFLVYERFKGRPPSVAFQNAVTLAGIALLATLFLVVTYNDIMRIVTM